MEAKAYQCLAEPGSDCQRSPTAVALAIRARQPANTRQRPSTLVSPSEPVSGQCPRASVNAHHCTYLTSYPLSY
jgi:hypothetical protein